MRDLPGRQRVFDPHATGLDQAPAHSPSPGRPFHLLRSIRGRHPHPHETESAGAKLITSAAVTSRRFPQRGVLFLAVSRHALCRTAKEPCGNTATRRSIQIWPKLGGEQRDGANGLQRISSRRGHVVGRLGVRSDGHETGRIDRKIPARTGCGDGMFDQAGRRVAIPQRSSAPSSPSPSSGSH